MQLEQKKWVLQNPNLADSVKLLGDPDKIISEFSQGHSIKTIRTIDPEQVKLASKEFTVKELVRTRQEEIEENNFIHYLDFSIKEGRYNIYPGDVRDILDNTYEFFITFYILMQIR